MVYHRRKTSQARIDMAIHRCPKCDARFKPPLQETEECPHCGIWFHKWRDTADNVGEADSPESTLPIDAPETPPPALPRPILIGRSVVLIFLTIWGFRLARTSCADDALMQSFMHAILLPIHEAGHIFFMPLGEFMTILGGSLFQVALPLGIGAAFLWRQRDAFGAAACLWWTGASLVDVSPYIWDALEPQLILIGGHTGEDGPHDWIYLLDRLGSLSHAHGWGTTAHHLGVLVMIAAIVWGALWLWGHRASRTTPV